MLNRGRQTDGPPVIGQFGLPVRQGLAANIIAMRLTIALICSISLTTTGARAAEPVDYVRDVKPVLKANCFACHGALKQEAGLRLDAATLIRKGGDSGPAIVAEKSGESLLIDAVTGAADFDRMPK